MGNQEVGRMEHTVFLTQIIGCVCAALVVALVWEHSRLRALERLGCELAEVVDLQMEALTLLLDHRDE